jgi:hypothetical protein
MDAEKANRRVAAMSRVLKVSSSGFHAWRRGPPSQRSLSDQHLTDMIRAIHKDSGKHLRLAPGALRAARRPRRLLL